MVVPLPPPLPPPPHRPLQRVIYNWRQRHRHPFNFWIHMLGIPIAVAGLVLLIADPSAWLRGGGGLVVGYLLQWIGHAVEGNDVGEWAGIKRLLGMPYVGISPRWPTWQPAESTKP